MENASKALIIAGAILLAILLISLGIMIFNQAQDTVSNSGMAQAEMQAFNNKFLKYEGKRTGSEVKALINEVLASNADSNNINRQVYVRMPGQSTSINDPDTSSIDTSKSYTVKLFFAPDPTWPSDWKVTSGCIGKIAII